MRTVCKRLACLSIETACMYFTILMKTTFDNNNVIFSEVEADEVGYRDISFRSLYNVLNQNVFRPKHNIMYRVKYNLILKLLHGQNIIKQTVF